MLLKQLNYKFKINIHLLNNFCNQNEAVNEAQIFHDEKEIIII